MSIDQAFNESIGYYDDWISIDLPGYDDIFNMAQELMPFAGKKAIKVLDLGAGTGLFSKYILMKYPNARFLLCDIAEDMLKVAQKRFRNKQEQFDYLIEDYCELNISRQFDLIVSSLSIHHLPDNNKQRLFAKVYGLLNKAGIFLNIDQIKGETPELQELYWTHWLAVVRKKGAEEELIQASIKRRLAYDKDALLIDQINWLKKAGFKQVDCVYKNYFIGLFYARKV